MLSLHDYENEESLNFEIRNASKGKALAVQQIFKNAYLQIYKYAPTAAMRQLLNAADFVKDAAKERIGFLTLRPEDKHCIVGSDGLDDFVQVVRRFESKRCVKEILCENFEMTEKDDVELWHYHCVFTFAMSTSQSTLYTTLSRGISNYLFENKHSVKFLKAPMKDRARLCGYVTKESRVGGPLPPGGWWPPLRRAPAAPRGDDPPNPLEDEVETVASVDAPFTGDLEDLLF